jgi:hypothetical protein
MEAGNLGKAPGRRGPGTAGLPWRWQHATLEASIHAAADVPRRSQTGADRAEHGPADLERKPPHGSCPESAACTSPLTHPECAIGTFA